MAERITVAPSPDSRFGPVKKIGPDRWEMDYSLTEAHYAHIEWTHEPTPEQIAYAHTAQLDMTMGETLSGRRREWGPFLLWRFKSVGPPRWWLPRFYPAFHRGGIGLRIGWRFTAYEWSIGRSRG